MAAGRGVVECCIPGRFGGEIVQSLEDMVAAVKSRMKHDREGLFKAMIACDAVIGFDSKVAVKFWHLKKLDTARSELLDVYIRQYASYLFDVLLDTDEPLDGTLRFDEDDDDATIEVDFDEQLQTLIEEARNDDSIVFEPEPLLPEPVHTVKPVPASVAVKQSVAVPYLAESSATVTEQGHEDSGQVRQPAVIQSATAVSAAEAEAVLNPMFYKPGIRPAVNARVLKQPAQTVAPGVEAVAAPGAAVVVEADAVGAHDVSAPGAHTVEVETGSFELSAAVASAAPEVELNYANRLLGQSPELADAIVPDPLEQLLADAATAAPVKKGKRKKVRTVAVPVQGYNPTAVKRQKKSKRELKEVKEEVKRQEFREGSRFAGVEEEEKVEFNDLPFKSFGFGAGFASLPIKRPYHRATGFQIAAANPFSAADLYSPAGPIIGIDLTSGGRPFTFDPWELYNRRIVASPNLLVQGSLRQGKSFFVKRLVTLLSSFGRYAINTSDSKGEHGDLALALGGSVFKMGVFGSPITLNPLEAAERRQGEDQAAYIARVRTARSVVLQQICTVLNPGGRQVTSRESAILDWALAEVEKQTSRPTVREVYELLRDGRIGELTGGLYANSDASDLIDGLRRLVTGDLAGMFDTHSSVELDPSSPYTVIDTYNISQRGAVALAVTQTVTNAWVQNTISNKTAGRRYFLIREEGWRDMRSVAALEAHQEQLKLSGEYGVAMVMIVHEDGDFDAVGPEGSKERELAKSILRGYANQISFYQTDKTLIRAVNEKAMSEIEAENISALRPGMFVARLRDRFYVVDGNPITTDFERHIFDTDKQMRGESV